MAHNVSRIGLQDNSDVTDAAIAALLFPTSGAKFATFLPAGSTKTIGQIWLAPGAGLPKRFWKVAIGAHDSVHVTVRGEVYRWGEQAPAPTEFHPATLRWAFKHSRQIAVWSAPYPEFYDDVGEWLSEASAGSPFYTIIETVPSRAAEWRELIGRWKGPRAEVRFFGPEEVQ